MKTENKKITTFSEHLDAQYGESGTETREKFEEEFESFKLGVLIQEMRKERGLTQEQLAQKAESLKDTWRWIGYNDAEIEMLSEAFFISSVKNKQTLREDKKAARKLMKDAKDSLIERLNANG